MIKKAVILLSGGIDSTTTAAIALDRGFSLDALVFKYGQKHLIEIDRAEKVAERLGIARVIVIEIPVEIFNSALTSDEVEVPRRGGEISGNDIPVTYVPARNILFLSYGLAYAESTGAGHIFIGANAVDYSGYPDCRPEFFSAYREMIKKGTKTGVEGEGIEIETPLLELTKGEIILKGDSLGIDYSLTHSCYDPYRGGLACGKCDSCVIRKKGFLEAGIKDPTQYYSEYYDQ